MIPCVNYKYLLSKVWKNLSALDIAFLRLESGWDGCISVNGEHGLEDLLHRAFVCINSCI